MSAEDPLHLVIKADSQEQLDDCIGKINAMMGQQHIKVRGEFMPQLWDRAKSAIL